MARVVLSTCFFACAAAELQPARPIWPDSVIVFDPDDEPEFIQDIVDQVYAENGGSEPSNHGEFSSSRYALLFKPGTYKVDVPVGYYTQVLGLGTTPEEVVFTSEKGIYSEEGNQRDKSGALSTFWRSAENFRTKSKAMLWATSQASPLRRAVLDGDLQLSQLVEGVGMGFASGGFMGNVKVQGLTQVASQQQYFMRNAAVIGDVSGGVWNLVFVGTMGAPSGHCGRSHGMASTVSVERTPVIAEKPFISFRDGAYFLNVPGVQRDRVGTDFSCGTTSSFEHVYVARAGEDTADTINEHLREGLHVVLTPGIYELDAPIQMARDNQVLLGLGLATLVATRGTAAVQVGNFEGVRVAGVLLQAGEQLTEALLEMGNGTFQGNPQNPSFLHDVFVRVGGDTNPLEKEVKANIMARITSGNVIGDNLWLWRADHGIAGETVGGANPCQNGLVVAGSDVTMYGLFVEHTLQDLVQWNGENGSVYFFQSEFPYDVDVSFGEAGYAGYRVGENVTRHKAFGVGVYHFFRDADVVVQRAISAPEWVANSFESPFSVGLSGRGRVEHVLNDRGLPTDASQESKVQWSCEKGPDVFPPTTTKPTTSTTATRTQTSTTKSSSTPTGTSETKTATVSDTSSSGTTMSSTFTMTTTSTSTHTVSSVSSTTTTKTDTDTITRSSTSVTETTFTTTTTYTGTTTPPDIWVTLLGSASGQLGGKLGGQGVLGLLCVVFSFQLFLAVLVCTCCYCMRLRRASLAKEGLSRPLPMDSPPRTRRGERSSALIASDPLAGMDMSMSMTMSPDRPEPRNKTLSSVVDTRSVLSRISRSYRQSAGRSAPPRPSTGERPVGRGTARELSVSSLDISGLTNSPTAALSPYSTGSPLDR